MDKEGSSKKRLKDSTITPKEKNYLSFIQYLIDKGKLGEAAPDKAKRGSQRLFSSIAQHLEKEAESTRERERALKPSRALSLKALRSEGLAKRIIELKSLVEGKIMDDYSTVITDHMSHYGSLPESISCTIVNHCSRDQLTATIQRNELGETIVGLSRARVIDQTTTIFEKATLFPDGSFVLGQNHSNGTPTHRWKTSNFSPSTLKRCGNEILKPAKTVEKLSRWFVKDTLTAD